MYACTCTHTRHVIHAVSIYVINICCKICRSHVHLYNGYAWALAFPLVIVVAFVIDHINFCIFATDQKCWFCFFWIYYFVFHTLGINTLNDWCSLHSETAHTQPLHSVLYFIRFSYGCWKWVCVCVSTICWARILRDKPRVRGVWKEQWFGLYVSKHHIIPCTVNIWNAKDQCAYIFGGNCRHYLCNERFMISNINAQAHTSKAFSVNNHFF